MYYDKSDKLMEVIDRLNDKYHKSVRLAVQGTDTTPKWHLRQENLSPCYTTDLKDILPIRCE